MIEQNLNKLILTFPTADSATTFAVFLQSLLTVSASPQPSQSTHEISEPPFEQSPEPTQVPPSTPVSPEPRRSRHAVLTEERQEQLFNQRQAGQTQHQRQLRAQTTLRDGVLPFSKPGAQPQPSGQPSPRQRAQQEGTFADGALQGARVLRSAVPIDLPADAAVPPEAGRSRLRPVFPKL
jgi:hypothetical protein